MIAALLLLAWILVSFPVAVAVGRVLRRAGQLEQPAPVEPAPAIAGTEVTR